MEDNANDREEGEITPSPPRKEDRNEGVSRGSKINEQKESAPRRKKRSNTARKRRVAERRERRKQAERREAGDDQDESQLEEEARGPLRSMHIGEVRSRQHQRRKWTAKVKVRAEDRRQTKTPLEGFDFNNLTPLKILSEQEKTTETNLVKTTTALGHMMKTESRGGSEWTGHSKEYRDTNMGGVEDDSSDESDEDSEMDDAD